MVKKNISWLAKIDVFQVVALILVVSVAVFLGIQWAGHNLKAASIYNYTLMVTLTSDQPETLSQAAEYQKVVQFQLSTDSPAPVQISAFKFNVLGGIKSKIIRQLNILPLSIINGSETVGVGEGWVYDFGVIQQTVVLSKSLMIVKDQPVVLDVYTDLSRRKDLAFGLDLVGIDSPLLADGIPVQSILYKIKG